MSDTCPADVSYKIFLFEFGMSQGIVNECQTALTISGDVYIFML